MLKETAETDKISLHLTEDCPAVLKGDSSKRVLPVSETWHMRTTVMIEVLLFSVTAMEPPSARCTVLHNEGGMDRSCHDNPGKTLQTGWAK